MHDDELDITEEVNFGNVRKDELLGIEQTFENAAFMKRITETTD